MHIDGLKVDDDIFGYEYSDEDGIYSTLKNAELDEQAHAWWKEHGKRLFATIEKLEVNIFDFDVH